MPVRELRYDLNKLLYHRRQGKIRCEVRKTAKLFRKHLSIPLPQSVPNGRLVPKVLIDGADRRLSPPRYLCHCGSVVTNFRNDGGGRIENRGNAEFPLWSFGS